MSNFYIIKKRGWVKWEKALIAIEEMARLGINKASLNV